jgi:hypothetical protein
MADDQAVQTAPAPPDHHSNRRVADVAGTSVLVIALLVLYGASFTMLGLMVMGTDACAYQRCGDQAWLNRALLLAGWGGGAILALTAAATLYRLVRNRPAWFVPLADRLRRAGGLGVGLRGDGDEGWSDLDPRVGAGDRLCINPIPIRELPR